MEHGGIELWAAMLDGRPRIAQKRTWRRRGADDAPTSAVITAPPSLVAQHIGGDEIGASLPEGASRRQKHLAGADGYDDSQAV
jgi:hypothetical protein